ncbi:MAG: yohK [Proteobacteria bacterium]|nr:yohK [Pseudomonadota bacterium]
MSALSNALAGNPAIPISLTIGAFWAAQVLQQRLKLMLLNPILMATAAIILLLQLAGIPYESYHEGAQYLEFLLKPAIVALGVPLYLQLEQIKKQAVLILLSQLVACVIGVVSAVLIARWLGASHAVAISLAPKSATTPIAIEVTRLMGGIPALSAIIVILTGIFGAVCGLTVLRWLAIKSPIARGLALGAAAHAVGTSHAMQLNRKLGAYSSLGLIVNGTLTGLLTPYLLHWLG